MHSGPSFPYGEKELNHLRAVDKKLKKTIDEVGIIRRATCPDIFITLITSIIGQQISTKAQATICTRLLNLLGEVTPQTIAACPLERIQACGTTMRKAEYILGAAEAVLRRSIILEELASLDDDAICTQLCSLRGIGRWTAEMLLIFSLHRPNVLSYDDLAQRRGLCMIQDIKTISREEFNQFRKRYSPYATVAGLYCWAMAAKFPQYKASLSS